MKFLIYTYRTFPWIKELQEVSSNVVILGKLKKDILFLEEYIIKNKPSMIIGIAKGNKTSVFETQTVNNFNGKKILKNGKASYSLGYPVNGYKSIKLNNGFTTTFCNWGMYRVQNILEKNYIEIKHSFIHIVEEDFEQLKEFLLNINL